MSDCGEREPTPWVGRFSPCIAAGGPVLDLACGGGRHTRWFLERGHPVTAVDRDVTRLGELEHPQLEVVTADLEAEPWPLGDRTFAGVVVTRYLWRPLLPRIVAAVGSAGVLIYETFAAGNERYRRPRNPEFLLRPGELLTAVARELRVEGYEDGPEGDPVTAMVQRICAVRPRR